ncbi:MAG: ParB/RepB/Spo0J family partition protein [Ruthenibacterium sp.]
MLKKKRTCQEHAKVVLLPVEEVTPSPFQARTTFDELEMKKLAVSILQNGLLQPISVRPTADGRWQLIAGERRLRACIMAGMEEIPAIVYRYEDEQTAALGLLENLQREQLNPFEQARALRDLLNLWDCTQEVAARKLGIAQPTLANKLRLLVFSVEQETMCVQGGLTERHARTVLRLPTPEARTKVLETVLARHYNVQQTEDLVQRIVDDRTKPKRHVMVRDVRIFVNTINRAVQLMTASGIPAVAEKKEQPDYIEYVVRIPTKTAIEDSQAGHKNAPLTQTEAAEQEKQRLAEEIEQQANAVQAAQG